jgi:hypothetical protein
MAAFTTATKQLLSNYACISTLEPTEIALGQNVTVSGFAAPFAGTHKVLDLPQYKFTGIDSTTGEFLFDENDPVPNQLLYACTGTSVEFVVDFSGNVTYTQTATWVTAGQIEDWLGIGTATAADTSFLTQCASAANLFCYRRRQEAGYHDPLASSPSGDVTLGTIMYGGMLYRQRGSIDSFASFGDGGAVSVTGLSGVIKQLLGIDRPQVA